MNIFDYIIFCAVALFVVILAWNGYIQFEDAINNFMSVVYEGGIDTATSLSSFFIGIGSAIAG